MDRYGIVTSGSGTRQAAPPGSTISAANSPPPPVPGRVAVNKSLDCVAGTLVQFAVDSNAFTKIVTTVPSGAPARCSVLRDTTHVDLYAVDVTGAIYDVAFWAGAGWITGYRISTPSVIAGAGFVASTYNNQSVANQFGAQLASFVSAAGVATSRSATHTDLFAVGNNGQIYTAWWDMHVQ